MCCKDYQFLETLFYVLFTEKTIDANENFMAQHYVPQRVTIFVWFCCMVWIVIVQVLYRNNRSWRGRVLWNGIRMSVSVKCNGLPFFCDQFYASFLSNDDVHNLLKMGIESSDFPVITRRFLQYLIPWTMHHLATWISSNKLICNFLLKKSDLSKEATNSHDTGPTSTSLSAYGLPLIRL